MTIEQWTVLLIFFATIVGLIRFQKSSERVFVSSALSCLAFDLVTTEQLLANATNQGLLTLMLLIMCSFALERTSYLRRLSAILFVKSTPQTYFRTLFTTLVSSAFLNNTAVVATLLSPIKNNRYLAPNRLLLPVSYAAILGGTLTLIGTSTNLIVNSMLLEQGQTGFAFFDFFLVGIAASLACLLVIYLRTGVLEGKVVKQELASRYFVEVEVQPDSLLIGKTVSANGLRNLDSLFLIEIVRKGRLITPVTPQNMIYAGDKLIFTGDVTKVGTLNQFDGLTSFAHESGLINDNLTEVVIRPGSAVIGKTLKTAGFRARFDAAVVAIRREGEQVSGKLGDVVIQSGDFLVLATGNDFAARSNISKNFFVLNGKKLEFMLSGVKEKCVVIGFAGAIATSVLFDIALLKCFIFYMAALFACGALTINEVKRRFPLEIWLIVLSALTLATTLNNVGISDLIAELVAEGIDQNNVYLALVIVYFSTLLLTELITNNAAAALIFPIAYSVAIGLQVSYLPFVMAVAFAASGSFISPYGYQTNLMVYNAGDYTLKDFVRFGIPVSITYSAVVLLLLPIVFPF
ncbi:SLC13 family permease [Psychrosphaera sp. 1_MG-2023]|uniref:SLC13 family permease n=1 Tax=Psychrosphaera sp. 1_MG-2023 TaxID=3062643 RepID=UPI0026E3FEAF|nr:SLC13 family permease [Psychrosphaera sp. 1_MG-2023]MDO6720000.1 SLC13 family permease [Psychrosphaera sp. 1_MG-2023]